ncbi:hypothetical protein FOL80_03990 [Lactobacillus reuteri]|uniref:hypothetical protein n=1 Tax=Limosilactobacillus reuteri TaxID=1598 RepID=UPI00146BE187|nr:hypothetical protein [Limosilactobacillus reuteri]NMV49272.1 hypothetical protein [Limosilactobacillus reuteri]NMV50843.1 hypothetical protein [Limosilactobacillus reuteri]NMV59620.1 hypothetical protein [Limosilactobacillus reuteri]NMV61467.1 hypothetical protein [Limosilactobacillus reuteri]NMV63180.1 hypothetical protein [Limosilactobacillus reuteri]
MKKRKLKKSLATTATVMAVTTGVTAISNSAKADTVQNSKNTIQQTLPDVNQQAQQNVCAAQDAVNKANADVATANNDLNIANQNLADADQNVDINKNQVKQTKEQLSSLEQTKENAQQVLTNAHDEYYELLKQPVNISYTASSGGGLNVYERSMLDYIAYDNQENLISKNQAYENFLANNYQGNIDFLKKIIAENEKTINYLKMGRPFEDNIKNLEQAKVTIKEELEELYKVAAAQREGKYYKPKDDIGWISTDSYGLSYSYSSANYNEWDDVDKIDHTNKLIENHEEALNKVQQRLVELHNKMQSAVEKAEKTSIAAQKLLQKLEQISQPLITATQQIKDAESAMSQAKQNLALQEELLTQAKDKRNMMQSQAINAQTKLLQALLNKTNSQEKLASAKEKLPIQTDALKYSSLINLEPLTVEPGVTPAPKVTTAIAVENDDHQNKAVITLPGDEQENKLPQGTKVVWKDDAKVAADLQRPGKHTEDVLIVFPDGSVILTNEQVTVIATEKQADANKEISPVQETVDPAQENNMRANDLSAQVVDVNNDNLVPEILVTPQTKQNTVQPNVVIKGQAARNNSARPSLAKSYKAKTTNNVLPRTGDESSLPIIALGAVIGLVGIGATLKWYE